MLGGNLAVADRPVRGILRDPGSDRGAAAAAPDTDDPGLVRERTALAWTGSALTMAASGVLITRAAFVGPYGLLRERNSTIQCSSSRTTKIRAV